MYCKHCGKEILEDSKFCPYCGDIIEGNTGNRLLKDRLIGIFNKYKAWFIGFAIWLVLDAIWVATENNYFSYVVGAFVFPLIIFCCYMMLRHLLGNKAMIGIILYAIWLIVWYLYGYFWGFNNLDDEEGILVYCLAVPLLILLIWEFIKVIRQRKNLK